MTPTQELRDKIRNAVDERVPSDGTAADTLFSDAELDEILNAVDYVEHAYAEAWSRKAGRLVSRNDGLVQVQAGTERFTWLDPIKMAEHALRMAAIYRAQVPLGGSQVAAIEQPDVLGSVPTGHVDLSRLLWEP